MLTNSSRRLGYTGLKGYWHKRDGYRYMPQEEIGDIVKAKAFFDKAQTAAANENFDYAIEMYMEGLRTAPDALEEGHLPLCEMALQQQGKGIQKPKMMERMKRLRGKTPLEQMINAEYLFTKDPEHLPYAEAILKAAVAGGFKKTGGWMANLIFQTNNASAKPSARIYILLKDSYSALGQFDKAIVACQRAVKLRPNDGDLADEFKNLSAELTMMRGKYDTDVDFRESIKDREGQEKLHAQAGVVKTVDYRLSAIEEARKKVAQNPSVAGNIFKLAQALSDQQTDESDNEAIELLENSYKKTSDFSLKKQAGLLRAKQLRRKMRHVKAKLEANPGDEQMKAKLAELTAEQNKVELEHCRLCMQNYPTDLKAKYDYGVQLVKNKQYNEAIPLLQEAQKDPRRKIASMDKVGLCFFKKGWFADAIDVFNQAIETYEIKDDTIAKDLRYNLACAHEENQDMEKALDLFRKLAQLDFSYKDVSQRVDKLRETQT